MYFVAEFDSPEYVRLALSGPPGLPSSADVSFEQPENQVVLWDRIVRRARDAKINVEGLKNKYAFRAIDTKGFRYVSLCTLISQKAGQRS